MAARKTSKAKPNHNKEFFEALRLMEEERGIPREFIADKIAEAIVVAARKDYGGNDIVSCVIDTEKEIFSVTARKTIVDEVTDIPKFQRKTRRLSIPRHLSTAL